MFSKRTDWNLDENAYSRAVRKHRESGREILDLTVSNPTQCGFEYPSAAILKSLAVTDALHYHPEPKGLLSARGAVAEYYGTKLAGTTVNPESIILTTGTSEAYSFLFRLLCEPGDEILIAEPSYPLFDFLAAIQDVKLSPFRLVYDHGWQFDFATMEQAIGPRSRAILVVHPNNPTGHFISGGQAGRLISLCRGKNLALIVDEVFLDYELGHDTQSQKPYGTFASTAEALTFVLSGLSKIAALPQMKLGWIVASGPPQDLREAVARLEVISDTYLSLSAPLQYALPDLLRSRGIIQSQILKRLRANLCELDTQLAGQKSISRLELQGGWYAVLRVAAVQTDEELAIRLLENCSVLVHPGHFYDFPTDGYLILSLLAPPETFRKGVTRLLEKLKGI
jgi:alanine-synthesizing transaminase